jgi:hypothetical protein
MNRPYIGLAKWIFPSYQHVCMNEALSAWAFSAALRVKSGSAANPGLFVGARGIVPLRPIGRLFLSYQHVCIRCAVSA